MIGEHLPPARLRPGVELTPEEQAHLAACPRCRVEQRLLARWEQDDGAELPEIESVHATLDSQRAGLTRSLVTGTLADPVGGPVELVGPDERYERRGVLGRGGMGEVRQVLDRRLRRTVAMKVAAPGMLDGDGMARFVEEAQVASQLQHPGIVPVHDLGELPDGSPFFTMKEVDGITLSRAATAVHRASDGRWEEADGWTLRRLVDACHRVAEAIAYAHSRGVCHRDLKPANVMLGAFGEVLVLDWGLARAQGDDVRSVRNDDDALATRLGRVAGTPPYMAPEQARGEPTGTPADVYALGALLRSVLTGRAPYSGRTSAEVLARVIAGPPDPWQERSGPIPPDLVALCDRAMAREAAERPTAAAFARGVRDWIDGANRRDRAEAAMAEAEAQAPRAATLRQRAADLRASAEQELAGLRSFDDEDAKGPAWAWLDEAAALETEAALAETRWVLAVQSALAHEPELPAAHAALAAHYRRQHERAEARGDADAERLLLLLAAHDDGRHARWLDGVGTLDLATEPAVEATLFPVQERGRRLHRGTGRSLGTTPLWGVELPMGRYVLDLGGVTLPLRVPRDGSAWLPRGPMAEPLRLPPADRIGDDCCVPAGWCRIGGDPAAPAALPGQSVWVEGFAIQRDPVTHAEYLAFLNALHRAGRTEEALRHAPRERPAQEGELGALLVAFDDGFALRADAEGDAWAPDWPAWMVSWHGARAYAAWRAELDGLPWRLPWEVEWEKAARGVDGRAFPWGDHGDPSRARVSGNQEGRPTPAPVGAHEADTSVYGVRGLAGNVCDWVLDVFSEDGPELVDGAFVPPSVSEDPNASRTVKGGSWCNPLSHARGAFRDGRHPDDRRWVIGFRLARSL